MMMRRAGPAPRDPMHDIVHRPCAQDPSRHRRPDRCARPGARLVLAGLVAAAAWGATAPGPREQRVSSGALEALLTAEPGQVALDRDVLLTLRVASPTGLVATLPPLDDRLAGFRVNGAFAREPQTAGGRTTREFCYRLTPQVAAEYRLAPLAVVWTDPARPDRPPVWLATRPMVFEVLPLDGPPAGHPCPPRPPVWIRPSGRALAAAAALAALAVALLWTLLRYGRRLQRAVQRRRMSPRDRALAELADLNARNLVAQGRFMEFFIAVSAIVRRYIERAHGIRAPEQTTEEFLDAVSRDPRFRPEVLGALRRFLETADQVKFAAYHPAPDVADRAFATASDYVRTDDLAQQSADRPDADPREGRR